MERRVEKITIDNKVSKYFQKVVRKEAVVGVHTLVSVPYSDVVMLSDEVAAFWNLLPDVFTRLEGIEIGKSTIPVSSANKLVKLLKHFKEAGLLEMKREGN